jgi:hypothetical protein
MIRSETIDDGACDVIKSNEHRFASETRWLPRRFTLKGDGFLLTCSGQSAINVFTASGFNGNFVFVPVEHRRHKEITIMCRR